VDSRRSRHAQAIRPTPHTPEGKPPTPSPFQKYSRRRHPTSRSAPAWAGRDCACPFCQGPTSGMIRRQAQPRPLRPSPNQRTRRLRALNPGLPYSIPSRHKVRTDTPHPQEIRGPQRPPLHRVQGFSAKRKLSSGQRGLTRPRPALRLRPLRVPGGAATSPRASTTRPCNHNGHRPRTRPRHNPGQGLPPARPPPRIR